MKHTAVLSLSLLFLMGFFSCQSSRTLPNASLRPNQSLHSVPSASLASEKPTVGQAATPTTVSAAVEDLQADASNDEAYAQQTADPAALRKQRIAQQLDKLSPRAKEALRKAQEIVKAQKAKQLTGQPLTKLEKREERKALRSVLRETKKNMEDEDILEIVLAILVPPLGVYLHEDDATPRFWITLGLWVAGLIFLWPVPVLGTLAFIAAIVYALLVVTESI